MSSSINRPDDKLSWFISGDRIAIVSSNTGTWAAIDETVSDGILVHYYGEPEPIPFDQPEQFPDFPPALHSVLVDYVKGKLFLDRAGQSANNPDAAAVYLSLSREHMRTWRNKINRKLPSLTTKIAGARYMVPFPINDR